MAFNSSSNNLDNPDAGGDEDAHTPQLGAAPNAPSLKRRLLSGAVWLGAGRVCSVGTFIAAHVLLGRTMPEQDYAAYLTSSATAVLLATIICFGTPKMLVRALKQQLEQGNLKGAKHAVRSCFQANAIIASVALLILLLGANYIGDEPKWRGLSEYPLLIGSWACLSAICLVSGHALQVMDDFRGAVLVAARNGGVIPNLLFFLVALYSNWSEPLSLGLAIALQVIFHFVALAVALPSIRTGFQRIAERSLTNKMLSDESDIPPMSHGTRWFLREGWPNFVIQLTSMSIFDLQIILVGLFASERGIADYGAALRFHGIINAVHALTNAVMTPFVAELIAQKKMRQLERVLRGSATLVAIPTLAVMTAFVLFPHALLESTFGPEFVGAAWPLRILSLGGTLAILSGSNSLTLIMAGRQHLLMIYSIAVSLLYLAVAVPMIYSWEVVGAALSVSVIFGLYNLWVTLVVKKEVGVWTTPTLAPSDVKAAFRAVIGR